MKASLFLGLLQVADVAALPWFENARLRQRNGDNEAHYDLKLPRVVSPMNTTSSINSTTKATAKPVLTTAVSLSTSVMTAAVVQPVSAASAGPQSGVLVPATEAGGLNASVVSGSVLSSTTMSQVLTVTSTLPCPESTQTLVDGTSTVVRTLTLSPGPSPSSSSSSSSQSSMSSQSSQSTSLTSSQRMSSPSSQRTLSSSLSSSTSSQAVTQEPTLTSTQSSQGMPLPTSSQLTSAPVALPSASDSSDVQSTLTSTVVVMYAGAKSDQHMPSADSPVPTAALSPEVNGESASPLFSLTPAGSTITTTTTIQTSTFIDIISTSLVTSYIQTTTTMTAEPQLSGSVQSTLTTSGPVPFATDAVPSPTSSIEPITTGPAALSNSTSNSTSDSGVPLKNDMLSSNIFQPAATGAIPSQISQRGGHPVPKTGVNQNGHIQTNKFYANFFLGNRSQGTWTHPYSVAWAKGNGNARSWGLSISHIDRSQLVYGNGDPARYFVNPVGIQSMILSASQLGASTALTMDGLDAFSANVNLAPVQGAAPIVTFPLIQGMGFVTGVYSNGTPLIQSSVFFSNLTYGGLVQGTQTARYTVVLADGTEWLIYMTATSNSRVPTLTLTSNSAIAASAPFSGSVQVAKNPKAATSLAIYDGSAGVYALRGSISAAANNATGTYRLSWTKGGSLARTLLMFALPHHVQTMPAAFSMQSRAALQLETTTKGLAQAVVADGWTMTENTLPYDMGFAPWSPTLRSRSSLPQSVLPLVRSVSSTELAENFTAQCDLDSMYFSGKGLAKFAMMIYAANDMAGNNGAASAGLLKLKTEFGRFVNNQQINPLVYDTVWGGVVSSCTYKTGDSGCDFGNTYYNDHHFHYGYFVYAAAVIAHFDPSWLTQGSNRAWVDMLVRDYANSVSNDSYFPFSRMFDWYHGHSWAHGLYETADGKDQESSSEDGFSSYALKMWGRVTGDANMEARGNLMLAITARSLTNYYLMQSNNTVQPQRFIGNRAAGILFENKIDHTTYFGTNIEYIEGIHMLPLNPSSGLTRAAPFVQEEWNTYFSNGRANVAGGWRGILYANLALVDPRSSYNFFAANSFSNEYLDSGASRTWYLAMAAALGGAS